MTTEHMLRASADEWLTKGAVDPEKAAALEWLIKQRASQKRARRRITVGAAAAALLLLPMLSPGMRAWAEETFPWIAQYISSREQFEPGWAVAKSEGLFQEVLATAQDKGYTFRVHRILATPASTTIVYSVEGPEPQAPTFWGGPREALRFDGQEFMRGGSSAGEIIDGVYVGSLEINALPGDNGTLTIAPQEIGQVQGNWHVSIPVSRAPITALSRTIYPNSTVELVDGVTLTVTQIDLIPTETVVYLTYEGVSPTRPPLPGVPGLITPDGVLNITGMSGNGALNADGIGTYTFSAKFPPLPADVAEASVRVKSLETLLPDATLELPASQGARAGVRDLPELELVSLADDHAVLRYSSQYSGQMPYHKWSVVDQHGNAYQANYGSEGRDGETTLRIDFTELPPDSTPVTLVSQEIWYLTEGVWELPVSLD